MTRPRPAPRLLDELAVAATPAERTGALGGWLVRVSPDLPFRRANSVVPWAAPDGAGAALDLDDRLAAVRHEYAAVGRPARVQLVPDADPPDLDAALAARGWVVEAPVVVLWAPLPLADHAPGVIEVAVDPEVPVDGAVADDPSAAERHRAYGRMLAPLGAAHHLAVARVDGEPVGVGRSVTVDGWTGLLGMRTRPTSRRRGVGAALVRALAARAAADGAVGLWLQVEEDNAAARRLYEHLGFETSHRYHYRTATQAATAGA